MLNIVNGMAMYTYIKENNVDLGGDVEPFNEAMCEGDITPDIFGAEFVSMRATVHGVGYEEYDEIVIRPLEKFLSLDYDSVTLHFDEDMFCQTNLITLLAYLDKNEYEGKVFVNIVDYSYNTLQSAEIKIKGFYSVYLELFIARRMPSVILPEVMTNGAVLYLEYSGINNPVRKYVEQNKHRDKEEVLQEVFDNFREYGLGDSQILKYFEDLD